MSVGSVSEYLNGFGDEEFVGSGKHRDVFEVPERVCDNLGLEGDYVLKFEEDSSGVQNCNEVEVYLESLERGEVFTPPVVMGSSDFEWILVGEAQSLNVRRSLPHKRDQGLEFREDAGMCHRDVIPEGWVDIDRKNTDYGVFDGEMVVIDTGHFSRDEWLLQDVAESDYVEFEQDIFKVDYNIS